MAINIDTPFPRVGAAFQISGSLTGYNSPPLLTYADDPKAPAVVSHIAALGLPRSIAITWNPPTGGPSYQSMPSGSTVSRYAYVFRHPPMSQGDHSIVVTDGRTGTRIGYAVSPSWHRRTP